MTESNTQSQAPEIEEAELDEVAGGVTRTPDFPPSIYHTTSPNVD